MKSFLKIVLIILLLFIQKIALAGGGCPDTPICGGESLDFFMSDYYSNQPYYDGMVLPVNTWVKFDAIATAYGKCDTQLPDCSPLPCRCVDGPDYQRTVNHYRVNLNAVTIGGLNGNYVVGYSFCKDSSGKTAFYNVLDTQSSLCNRAPSALLSAPGTYIFYFYNAINNPVCLTGICPDRVAKSATIYVAETINDDCNTVIGNGVSVASGIVTAQETDFSLSGVMPITFIRYYNSKTANTLSRGFGATWGHLFDTIIDTAKASSNLYKLTNPNGSVVYYRDGNGDTIYEAVSPKGEASSLIKNPDNTLKKVSKNGTAEEFNPSGYMTAVIDRNGNRISLARDSGNKLTTITDPTGRVITITYDTSNRINKITLPDGKAISYVYYNNVLQKVIYPDGTNKTYEYLLKYLTGIKNENGKYIKKYTYDSKFRASTSSADGTNEKLTIAYVDNSHSKVTDSFGRVTTYTIDKTGGKNHASAISGPGCTECGQSDVTYTYDDNLNITSMTDGSGNVTVYTYDEQGNILTSTEASGTADERTITYTYHPTFNEVTSITDPKGNVTTFEYDAQGNLTSATDPSGATTTITRNPQGLITAVTDALGKTTAYTHDQYGNLATVVDALGKATTYVHDIMGRLLSLSDSNGNIITYTYDLRGRLKTMIDGRGMTTAYAYDPAGNLTGLNDPRGNSTAFTFDPLGRLIRETDPLGRQRTFGYDTQSNLTIRTDEAGRITSYGYNDRNRLASINHPDGSRTTYTYDTIGNLLAAANPAISYTFANDSLGRLVTATDSRGITLTYEYDDNSNVVTRTDTFTGSANYAYDGRNLLTMLLASAGRHTTYSYDSMGRRTAVMRPSGSNAGYTYDFVSRLLDISDPAESITYTYDNTGNRIAMADSAGVHAYAYDPVYQLVQAEHQNQPNEVYTYDENGNRLGTVVDAANQLLEDSNYRYIYDVAGNLATKTAKAGGQVTTYSYDIENRLIGVVYPGMAATYAYDPFGRRIEKNVNGSVTRYVYDREDIIYELDGTGNIVTEYVHGPGIDEPLAMIRDGQTYYFHADGLGSIRAITDEAGVVVQRYEYDSFGNITFELNPAFVQPYTFTGREFDPESGMYYYRNRTYNPVTGKFIQKDPIGFAGGDVNLMRYVGNNPVNFVDPLGLFQGAHPLVGMTASPYYIGNETSRKKAPLGIELIYHGLWCGPGWTGGQAGPYSPKRNYMDPIDDLDRACEGHDKCYYACREKYPCDAGKRQRCMTDCNKLLATEAATAGHKYSSPLWWWMQHMPARREPDACGCKK